MSFEKLPKVIVVLGPTASGKTDLGIKLAKECNGEIISADSRQVYKKLNIGTAKPNGSWKIKDGVEAFYIDDIAHHLMDCIASDEAFSVADFKRLAEAKIFEIVKRNHVPIIVGGTGLYIWSLTDNLQIPSILPQEQFREYLQALPLERLVARLKIVNANLIQTIDLCNPRRVMRALEIARFGNTAPTSSISADKKYNYFCIGLNWPKEELIKRADMRIDEQIKNGLVEEAKQLFAQYDSALPSLSSIGYAEMKYYFGGETNLPETIQLLKNHTRQYIKRQITWFKRDQKIHWIDRNGFDEANRLVQAFLQS